MSEPTNIEDMTVKLLKEHGPLTAREIAIELAHREWAYAVVNGNKSTLSKFALERKLEKVWNVKRIRMDGDAPNKYALPHQELEQ